MNHKSAQMVVTSKNSIDEIRHSDNWDVAVVAGAAGFVGSRICEVLLDADISVIGIDNYISGKEKYLEKLLGNEKFEIIEANIQQGVPAGLLNLKPKIIIDALDVFPHIGRTGFGLNELLNNSVGLKNLLEYANVTKATVLFTSSADIYQGLASHESLKNYYDGQELTTYYEYLEGKRYGEALCREYCQSFGLDIRILRIPEIYGPRMDLISSSIIARAIRMGLEGKDLVFDEDGSLQHHLLYVDDLAYGVLKLALNSEDQVKSGIFYLVNPETVSTLSIAYTLRAIVQKDLKVEFIPSHRKVGYPVPQKIDISRTMKLLHWNPQVDLTEGLERTLNYFILEAKKQPVSKSDELTIEPKDQSKSDLKPESMSKSNVKLNKVNSGWQELIPDKLNPKKIEDKINQISLAKVKRFAIDIVLGSGIFIFVALLPLLFSIGLTYQGYQSAQNGNYVRAEQLFTQINSLWNYYKVPLGWIGKQDQHRAIDSTLQGLIYGMRFVQDAKLTLAGFNQVGNTIYQSWQQGVSAEGYSESELSQITSSAIVNWRSAQTWFSLMDKTVANIDTNDLAEPIKSTVEEIKNLTWIIRPSVASLTELIGNSNLLLGFNEPQKILIMLQNNNEIRPTGGFLGSYAILTIESGKVISLKVDDIYNPDGLLTDSDKPLADAIIKKYYQVEKLSLRDANWWADFQVSANTVKKLYEKATNESVSTIVGVNLLMIEDLLNAIGPVQIEDLNETITAENVGEKTQVYAEVGFTPGSSQKKDFLGLLSQAIFTKLGELDTPTYNKIFMVLGKNIISGNIAFYTSDHRLAGSFEKLSIDGRLKINPSADYIKVVDNNVGGNKVNAWVVRKGRYQLDIGRNGEIAPTLTITWKNNATGNTWPQGEYVNHVEIFVPKDTEVIGIDPVIEDYEVKAQMNAVVISGTIRVAPGMEKYLRINYRLPPNLFLSEKSNYELIWDPQPGITSEEVTLQVNVPAFLQTEGLTTIKQKLTWPIKFTIPFYGTETISKDPN